MTQHVPATNFEEYEREISCVSSREIMRSAESIKSFIGEQYIEGLYSHLPINRRSNLNGPVSNSHDVLRNNSGNVDNEVAVVPDMDQRLSVAVAPDMGQRLIFDTSNSHVDVGTGIKNNSEVIESMFGHQKKTDKLSRERKEVYQEDASKTVERAEFIKELKKRTKFNQTNEGKMKLREKRKCAVDK